MITMEAFDAYKIYMALKAHFNSDYDFNKYGGKTTVTKQSYLKRKDGEEEYDFTRFYS